MVGEKVTFFRRFTHSCCPISQRARLESYEKYSRILSKKGSEIYQSIQRLIIMEAIAAAMFIVFLTVFRREDRIRYHCQLIKCVTFSSGTLTSFIAFIPQP